MKVLKTRNEGEDRKSRIKQQKLIKSGFKES